jgi:hypothetical protein
VIRGEGEVESNLERAREAKTNVLPENAGCETAWIESDQSLGRYEPEVRSEILGQ